MDDTRAAGPEWFVTLISPTRRELLSALRRRGEAGVAGLSEELYLSVSAVRQMLETMKSEGLVVSREVRAGSGRPRKQYRLTPNAESLFEPDQRVLLLLLNAALDVVERGAQLDHENWALRVAQLGEEMLRPGGLPAGARSEQSERLVELFAVLGYDPAISGDGHAGELELRACPVMQAARDRRVVCELERQSISAHLGGAPVERGDWRLQGDAISSYRIRPRTNADPER